MQNAKNESAGGMRWWVKAIFGVSLALNLAFIGLIAGAALRVSGKEEGAYRAPGPGAFGVPYMMALSRDDRREIFGQIRAERRAAMPDRDERRARFREVLDSLRAQPFDRARLESIVDQQAASTVSLQRSAQNAWVTHVAQMSDAERAAYADAVEDVLRRGGKRR
ncbi:MAG: periplasmic heavy metal sensor [Pseudomonadota bacterium]